jgi:hypothetical protein
LQTLKLKTIIGSLAVGLMLTAAVHAQMGPMTGMPQKGSKGTMPGSMMGNGGMMGGMMKDMMPIRSLLMNHDAITRTVQDIPGGVRTVTTSKDPEIAKTIRTHVWQMKERLTKNEPIRQGDPLFRQIFLHHNEINLQVQDIPGGVRTVETSKNPQATLLIRQHARAAVSEFVKYGMPRAMQPTPLPKSYHPIGGKTGTAAMGGMMGM